MLEFVQVLKSIRPKYKGYKVPKVLPTSYKLLERVRKESVCRDQRRQFVMELVNRICPARDNACLLIQEVAVNGHVHFRIQLNRTSSGQPFFFFFGVANEFTFVPFLFSRQWNSSTKPSKVDEIRKMRKRNPS